MWRARRRTAYAGLLMAVWCVWSTPLRAQNPTSGELRGTVVDGRGGVLRGVFVTLREESTGSTWNVYTTRDGTYRFTYLATGTYEVRLETVGYAPKRVTSIPVRPGRTVTLRSGLRATTSGVQEVDTEAYGGAALSGAVSGGQWLPSYAARHLAGPGRDLSDLVRLSTVTDESLNVEGLPASLSALQMDGTVFRPASHPVLRRSPFEATSFPLASVSSAEMVTNGADVEWAGVAGGVLNAQPRRGTPAAGVEATAHWSGSALSSIELDRQSFNELHGSLTLSGPVLDDSARFVLGVQAQRLATPLSRAWLDNDATAALVGLGESHGLGLDAYRRAALLNSDVVSGFGRLDWSISSRNALELGVRLMTAPRVDAIGPSTGAVRELEATDVVAGGAFRSLFESGFDNEVRIGITSSTRTGTAIPQAAATFVAREALALGGGPAVARAEETVVTLSDAVVYSTGNHAFKFGGAVRLSRHQYQHREGGESEYLFGGVSELMAERGAFRETRGSAPIADWNGQAYSLFVQDRWTSGTGVDVLLGVRGERERLPSDRVRRDAEWLRLGGVANDVVPRSKIRWSPRVAVTWDVDDARRWVLHTAGGVYYDRLDPLVLTAWQVDDGTATVQRAVGSVTWPPGGSPGGVTASRLTLLGPDFEAPRTNRLSAGLVHRPSGRTAFHVTASARRTEKLPRRNDMNRLPAPNPSARDQFGRAVYGTLAKEGGLLAAVPGSGRRFSEYDEVALIAADGWSNYWGVTFGIEQEATASVDITARYTFSRTRDNWFGARGGGWLVAPPAGLEQAGDWSDGTSDFDAPHRFAAGVLVRAPAGVRVGGVYRFQSGRPYTPGFRAGIDASADGYAGNDPAFVDTSVPGMSELIARESCLAASAGRFAARNSCRASATHTLDLNIGWDLFTVGGASASVLLDAFDLLQSERTVPDAALYLVDPSRPLVTDAVARTVTVPLLVNEDFGRPLVQRHRGRAIRLGLGLRW